MSRPQRFISPSWSEIEELCMDIAEEVVNSGYRPDVVIGVLRGGVIPAKLVADYLGVGRLATIEVKFYRGIGVRAEEPIITQPLLAEVRNMRILIVDDVADTGKTLARAVSFVSHYGPLEVRTATVYVKPWAALRPDYFGEETDAWIIFPWDKGETVRELVMQQGFSIDEAAEVTGLPREFVAKVVRLVEGLGEVQRG